MLIHWSFVNVCICLIVCLFVRRFDAFVYISSVEWIQKEEDCCFFFHFRNKMEFRLDLDYKKTKQKIILK